MIEKFRVAILLLILVVLSWIAGRMQGPGERALAQAYGTNYLWSDSVATTTTAIDSIFDTPWISATLKADGADMYIRAGAPDTTDFGDKDWVLLSNAEAVTFGPATGLYRLSWKTAAGTGTMNMLGYKRVVQVD